MKLAAAMRAGIPNIKTAHKIALAAPAIAQICGRAFTPASRPRRTKIGMPAARLESHQCPSGSYACVQTMGLASRFVETSNEERRALYAGLRRFCQALSAC